MKKIWSGIRSIINISKVKADYISSILEGGKTVDNPCPIANILNNFFVKVGKNTDKDIPCGNCCPTTSFLKGNFPDSMFLSPVTSVEVDSYISQMDNKNSIGPYGIPVPLLKILKTHISPLISSLINDFFLCGIFPSKIKLAKVTPVTPVTPVRKALGKTKITIGQYQFYLFLVKFLKRPCLNGLNVVSYIYIYR